MIERYRAVVGSSPGLGGVVSSSSSSPNACWHVNSCLRLCTGEKNPSSAICEDISALNGEKTSTKVSTLPC